MNKKVVDAAEEAKRNGTFPIYYVHAFCPEKVSIHGIVFLKENSYIGTIFTQNRKLTEAKNYHVQFPFSDKEQAIHTIKKIVNIATMKPFRKYWNVNEMLFSINMSYEKIMETIVDSYKKEYKDE